MPDVSRARSRSTRRSPTTRASASTGTSRLSRPSGQRARARDAAVTAPQHAASAPPPARGGGPRGVGATAGPPPSGGRRPSTRRSIATDARAATTGCSPRSWPGCVSGARSRERAGALAREWGAYLAVQALRPQPGRAATGGAGTSRSCRRRWPRRGSILGSGARARQRSRSRSATAPSASCSRSTASSSARSTGACSRGCWEHSRPPLVARDVRAAGRADAPSGRLPRARLRVRRPEGPRNSPGRSGFAPVRPIGVEAPGTEPGRARPGTGGAVIEAEARTSERSMDGRTLPSIVEEFNGWLAALVEGEGSDLHVKAGSPPKIRLPAGLEPLERDAAHPRGDRGDRRRHRPARTAGRSSTRRARSTSRTRCPTSAGSA